MAIYRFTFEMDVEGPPPPDPPADGELYVVCHSHRVYEYADTPVVAWIRTESGKYDMTNAELSVVVELGGNRLVTLPATSSEAGKLEFTVPGETIRNKFPRQGPYVLKAFDGSLVIYTALLEVV